MRNLTLIILLLIGGSLAGCAAFDTVVGTTTGAGATVVDRLCESGMSPLAVEARMDAVDEINSKTTVGNWTATDCNKDGLPDFDIGPDGMVVR